jgi:hypothetical protein
MTQELVLWVLIAGLIGLVWVLTCSILTEDRPSRRPSGDGTQDRETDRADSHSPVKQRVAA